MRRVLQRAAATAGLLPVVLGLAAVPATAAPAAVPSAVRAVLPLVHFKHVRLPLSGTIAGTTENIAVTGTLDVRVRTLAGGNDIDVQVVSRLINTTGRGLTSGRTYRFVGTDTERTEVPPTPIRLTFNPTFLEFPPNPIIPPVPIVPPQPIKFLTLSVSLAGDGSIGAVAATVNGGGGGGGT
ncbi:hypothetical protein ABZW30_46840 [Kitasatospora sp. NPDC004669]|uniref:hypothetical protein n=1 Tax=Kitasatospora sp. NPDC004669 TaxID=3154555 RepID=UPI0033B2E35C